MESLINEIFRNGQDEPFKKGQYIRFRANNNSYFYGIIDNVYDNHCEVSYGYKSTLKKFLRRDCNLDYFCDVDFTEIELLEYTDIEELLSA